MRIEIRVRTIKEAYESLDSNMDIIAVGDENCIYKLPEYEVVEELVIRAGEKKKKIRVVFPKVPNQHFPEVCELLEKVSALDVYLTLNDYGLMYKAGNLSLKNGFAVGRNVAYSLFSSPWYGLLVKDENPEMRLALATNNMESKLKLEFIRNMGGNEIEIEYIKEICETTNAMRKLGFQVTAHYDACLVAYGRCCPVMKFRKEKTENCADNCCCYNPYSIELHEKFVSIPVQDKSKEYSESTHYVKDDSIAELFPTLYVYGNGLYRNNTENNFCTEAVTTCVLNSFQYKSEEEKIKAVDRILCSK